MNLQSNITLDHLRKLQVKRPSNATSRFQALPHGELVDAIVREMNKPWIPGDIMLVLAVSRNELDLSATFVVGNRSMTVLNSNGGEKSIRMLEGTLEEDYLLPLVKAPYGRRHVKGISADAEAISLLDSWKKTRGDVYKVVRRLQNWKLSNPEHDRLLLMAARSGLMPWSRLKLMDGYYTDTPHRTGLDLLKAFAKAAKSNPPDKQVAQIYDYGQRMFW